MKAGMVEIKPSERQAIAWEYLQDAETKYILYGGGVNSGKTWLSCEWILMMATTFPFTRYFAGRDELKKVRESWLITWYKVLRHHGISPDSLFKFNGQDNYLQFFNGSRVDLLDLGHEPSDPFFERLGSVEYTSGTIEEAAEVDFKAFETLKSRIGRCENERHGLIPKILLTCNPKRNWLYTEFYKPWKDGTLPQHMKFIPALFTDNIYADRNSFDSLNSITDRVMRARLLEGDWEYSEDETSLIEPQALQDVFSRQVSAKVAPGNNYLTCDIARMGKDSTTVVHWQGLRVEKIYTWEKLNTLESARKIRALAADIGMSVSRIIIDSDGIGGGVSDQLYGCTQFINNAVPLATGRIKANFVNLKSQCYYKLAELINNRQIFINVDNIELRNRIAEELEQVKASDPDNDGKLSVARKKVVKKALGRSPDLSDALMMRMYFELKKSYEIRLI